jgi:hypothetical protein
VTLEMPAGTSSEAAAVVAVATAAGMAAAAAVAGRQGAERQMMLRCKNQRQ